MEFKSTMMNFSEVCSIKVNQLVVEVGDFDTLKA